MSTYDASLAQTIVAAAMNAIWVVCYVLGVAFAAFLALLAGKVLGETTAFGGGSDIDERGVHGGLLCVAALILTLLVEFIRTAARPEVRKEEQISFAWMYITWLLTSFIEAILIVAILAFVLFIARKILDDEKPKTTEASGTPKSVGANE